MWSSKVILERGIQWRIGDGRQVSVLEDPWIRDKPSFRVDCINRSDLSALKVCELILH